MESSTNHQNAFAEWAKHKNQNRLDTDTYTHELLRKAYPDHHVTRTNASKCDILGFAKAGHAKADLAVDTYHDATRVYRAPTSRLQGEFGKVEDVVYFGRWQYEWQDNHFMVYEVTYLDIYGRIVRPLFVVATMEAELVVGGYHKAVDQLLTASGEWTSTVHQQIWVFDSAEWVKSKSLWAGVQETKWDDVIIDGKAKNKLTQDVHGFSDNRKMYQKAKIPWKRGIIFHGVPGNGKTLFTKAIINSLSQRDPPVPALYVKSLDACAGPKWSLQQIFNKTRRTAPCLLVLEDLDSLVGDDTRSYFLNEVDGLNSNDGILMIGSTNHLDRLDPAVTKRPSRFDRKYHFGLPTEEERVAYCQHWRKNYAETGAVEFPDEACTVIAKWTEGFSFAYLKELFVCSLLLLTRGDDEDADLSGEAEISGSAETKPEQDGTSESQPESPDEARQKSDKDDENEDGAKAEMPNTSHAEGEEKKPKRTLPEVDIPVSVRENGLLKTMKVQVKALLADIDHSASVTTKQQNDSSRGPPIRFEFPDTLADKNE